MKLSRLHQVALAVGLALPGAWASAAPVQTTLYLNFVDLRLTDLNETDGIGTSLEFAPSSEFSLFVSPGIGGYETSKSSGSINSNVFDTTSGFLALDGGEASAAKSESIQTVSAILGQDVLSDSNLSRLMFGQSSQEIYGQVKAYSNFTLGAHSKATFLAQFLLLAYIDTTEVGDLPFLQSHPDQQVTLQGFSKFSVYALDSNGQSVGNTPDGIWTKYVSTTYVSRADDPWILHPEMEVTDGLLEIEVSNDSDVAMDFSINSIASGRASVSVTSAVPESGTVTLMGLGLVGIAAVTRRRSA